MKVWQPDDVRDGFTEIARGALAHEPQRVELGPREAVVILSAEDYAVLAFARDLVDFVRRSSTPTDFRASVDRFTRERRADAAPMEET